MNIKEKSILITMINYIMNTIVDYNDYIYPEVDFLSWIKLINSGNINGINQISNIIDYCDRNDYLNILNEYIIEDLNTCDYKSNPIYRNIIKNALKNGHVFDCDLN